MKRILVLFSLIGMIFILKSCKKDEEVLPYQPTPYDLRIPFGFPQMVIPADNPLTEEGVELGRRLFYDELLSGDNSISCATCHHPNMNFSDSAKFSTGITGQQGGRQSMPLINLGWQQDFFWDGRASSLEEQVLQPVINPIEMNEHWPNAIEELKQDFYYPEMFRRAFGDRGIDSVRVSKVLAQFLRTMISANSRYDKSLRGELVLTSDEFEGKELFNRDKTQTLSGADCFHCHGAPMYTDNFSASLFHNNGLDATFADLGRGMITGDPNDNGKFKAPTLRNIALTAPYMHDGRFATLSDAVEHYNTGLVSSPTIDPLMKFVADGGVELSVTEKNQLIAFLNALTDTDFAVNPKFQDPGY